MNLPKNLQEKLNQYIPVREQPNFIYKVLEEALQKFEVKNKMTQGVYQVYSDGGARGNPGPAGCGVVVFANEKEVVAKTNSFLPHATNNEAEYMALLLGIQKVIEFQPKEVVFYLDSELIVKQMRGEYKIKKAELKVIFDQIKTLLLQIPQTKFVHIPRIKNQLADQLVNLAIDQGLKKNSKD